MKKLSEFELGYLAALIDQYATLDLMRCHLPNGRLRIQPSIRIYVKAPIREHLSKMVRGGYTLNVTNKRHDHKPTFAFNLCAHGPTADLLEQVGPCLTMKKEHARLIAAFCRSRKARGFRPEPYSAEELAICAAFKKLPGDRKRRGYKSEGMS